MTRQRVLLAHTGGTIGMRRGPLGFETAPGHLERLLGNLPELGDPAMPELELHEFQPLLDSSDMVPADWLRIARAIEANYHDVAGFVILHGTDTLAYTASALSFMLEGLGKPVIITGSQLPLSELRSDARENLIASALLAARTDLHEVCVFFGSKLFRGNRVTKVSASGFDAFDSPNEAVLAEVGIDIVTGPAVARPPQGAAVRVYDLAEVSVAAVRLFPGIKAELLHAMLSRPVQGVVLETYGAGNAPSRDGALIEVIAEATTRGVVIVNCTQCLRGRVDMGGYATGAALARAGVVSGADMTPEAALTKLIWLLGKGLPSEQVNDLLGRNLCGELTA